MKKQTKKKHVHAGGYVARVEVELVEDETGWSPYLEVEEAQKLDKVRKALEEGDLQDAAQYGEIYEMRKVS